MTEKRDIDLLDRTKKEEKTKKPRMYKVVILNDDFTPMDFVCVLIQELFHKTFEEAQSLTLDIHKKGSATCGVYTFEVAETKAILVHDWAKKDQHPLRCAVEPE